MIYTYRTLCIKSWKELRCHLAVYFVQWSFFEWMVLCHTWSTKGFEITGGLVLGMPGAGTIGIHFCRGLCSMYLLGSCWYSSQKCYKYGLLKFPPSFQPGTHSIPSNELLRNIVLLPLTIFVYSTIYYHYHDIWTCSIPEISQDGLCEWLLFRYIAVILIVHSQIVGCPFSGGQPKIGVDEGPIHLVEAGLVNQLQELGWNVKFDGHHQFEDIKYTLSSSSATASSPAADTDNDTSTTSNHWDPPIGILKNPRLVSRVCEEVAKVVSGHAKKGELPVTLGGDHSLAMGTISGTLEWVIRMLRLFPGYSFELE